MQRNVIPWEHPTRRELFGSALPLSDRGDKLPLRYPRHDDRPRSDGCDDYSRRRGQWKASSGKKQREDIKNIGHIHGSAHSAPNIDVDVNES